MTRIESLFLVFLCFTAVLAIPFRHDRPKRSFKVERIRQRDYVPHGGFALRKVYTKYGLSGSGFVPELGIAMDLVPEEKLETANGERFTVEASASQNDAEFLSPVSVGGQTLVMDFDSGSSDMWVFNTELPASSQLGHTIYNPTQSSTFSPMNGATFNISYGDGSFSRGIVGVETVDIGGATVTNQAIGLPTEVANSFVSDTSSNGLVGLAFSTLNTVRPQRQKTFFDNVLADLTEPVFTANLKHGTAGGYEFGAIDSSQFSGSLITVPVNSNSGFWEFTSTTVAIGDGQAEAVQGGSGRAIADTGTSLLIVDPAVVQAYWGQVQGAKNSAQFGGVIFPCANTLPDLSIAVGDNYMAKISGSLLNFANAGTDNSGTPYCFGAVQSNGGSGLQIYGDIFFKSQFVVFDGSGPSLQVAPHA